MWRQIVGDFVDYTAITEKDWSAQWTVEKVFAYAQECVNKSSTGEFAHGNRNRPIPLRTLCQILDNKGYQRMRTTKKRGYLVVELEATEINSSRIATTGTLPF